MRKAGGAPPVANVAQVPIVAAKAPKGTAGMPPAAKVGGNWRPGAQAKAADQPTPGMDFVKEAERRLFENKQKKIGWDEVAKLKEEFALSENVELGMKLLHPTKLWQLLRSVPNPRQKLQQAIDKEQVARQMIGDLDPVAAQLVKQLEAKDNAAGQQ